MKNQKGILANDEPPPWRFGYPLDGELETRVIRECRENTLGNQNVHTSSNQTVCRCCGK